MNEVLEIIIELNYYYLNAYNSEQRERNYEVCLVRSFFLSSFMSISIARLNKLRGREEESADDTNRYMNKWMNERASVGLWARDEMRDLFEYADNDGKIIIEIIIMIIIRQSRNEMNENEYESREGWNTTIESLLVESAKTWMNHREWMIDTSNKKWVLKWK